MMELMKWSEYEKHIARQKIPFTHHQPEECMAGVWQVLRTLHPIMEFWSINGCNYTCLWIPLTGSIEYVCRCNVAQFFLLMKHCRVPKNKNLFQKSPWKLAHFQISDQRIVAECMHVLVPWLHTHMPRDCMCAQHNKTFSKRNKKE